ncbi:hypothetical protein EON67_09140, partial [archaeon]
MCVTELKWKGGGAFLSIHARFRIAPHNFARAAPLSAHSLVHLRRPGTSCAYTLRIMRVACARPSLARCLLSVAVCALYEVRCCVASQDTTTSNALYTVVGGWTGDGGLASQAALYGARSVWHAPSAGALLVTEFWGHRVRTLWLHNGTIATLAGSARGVGGFAGDAGRATDALLLTPSHASMDEAFPTGRYCQFQPC